MRVARLAPACFALLATSAASAATFPLSFTADNSCRFYDFYLGIFAQLDRTVAGNPPPNRLYAIDSETDPFNPHVYDDTGETAVVFASGRAFASVGSITYTGSGNGTHAITAVTLDIGPYVQADEATALGSPYTTTVTNPVGTITIANGVATVIQLDAGIRFEQDASFIPPLTTIPYEGMLSMAGDRFDIFVDDEYDFGHGILRNAWDLTGSIDGVGDNLDLVFANGFE